MKQWHSLVLALSCAACGTQTFASKSSNRPTVAKPAVKAISKSSLSPEDKGAHLYEDAQKALGIICEKSSDATAKRQKVVYVANDSFGETAGLHDGDEIVSAQVVLDQLKLSIMRHNLPLALEVKLTGAARAIFEARPFELQLSQTALGVADKDGTRLSRQQAQMGKTIPNVIKGTAKSDRLVDATAFGLNRLPVLDVNQRPQKIPVLDVNDPARILAKFQMELIVDQSMSMTNNADCPGNLSRWNWCGVQATDLARAVAPFEAGGLTITTFNGMYQVHRHAAAQDLVRLFANPNFQRGTRLAEPLHDRFDDYFSHRNAASKPLLIAVITDGVPVPRQEPAMVIQELVQASRAMHNDSEVKVVFFQVGARARFGQNFLQYLDQNLGQEGAQYHLVHTVPFDSLVQNGLARSLAQAVQAYGQKR